MSESELIYSSWRNKKRMGIQIPFMIFGVIVVGEISMYLSGSPLSYKVGLLIIGIVIMVVFEIISHIKVHTDHIYIPPLLRINKERKRLPYGEIVWIKFLKNDPSKEGLQIRVGNEEYFISNSFGEAEVVLDAIEEAMEDEFYDIYEGEV